MHIEVHGPLVLVLLLAPQIAKVLVDLVRVLVGSRTRRK